MVSGATQPQGSGEASLCRRGSLVLHKLAAFLLKAHWGLPIPKGLVPGAARTLAHMGTTRPFPTRAQGLLRPQCDSVIQ